MLEKDGYIVRYNIILKQHVTGNAKITNNRIEYGQIYTKHNMKRQKRIIISLSSIIIDNRYFTNKK